MKTVKGIDICSEADRFPGRRLSWVAAKLRAQVPTASRLFLFTVLAATHLSACRTTAPTTPEAAPSFASAPPDYLSFDLKEKPAAVLEEATPQSLDPQATLSNELRAYRENVFRKIAKAFDDKLGLLFLRKDETGFSMRIHPDGSISDFKIIGNRSDAHFNQICLETIEHAVPFAPFPRAAEELFADGFWQFKSEFLFKSTSCERLWVTIEEKPSNQNNADPSWDTYIAQLTAILERNWRPRLRSLQKSPADPEETVLVKLNLHRDGRISMPTIIKKSVNSFPATLCLRDLETMRTFTPWPANVQEREKEDFKVLQLSYTFKSSGERRTNSVADPETNAYDQRLVTLVKEKWYNLVEQRTVIATGCIVVEFDLHANGTVSDLAVINQTVDDTLASLCLRAIQEIAPFAPWPAELRKEIKSQQRVVRFTFNYD